MSREATKRANAGLRSRLSFTRRRRAPARRTLTGIRLLLTEVGFFDSWIGGQIFRGALHYDSTGLEDVGAIGMAQGCVCVLLNQQNRRALAPDLIDGFENRVDDQRRQTE